MNESDRLDARLAFLERAARSFVAQLPGLHVDETGDDLQVVFDAMVHLLKEDLALLEAFGQSSLVLAEHLLGPASLGKVPGDFREAAQIPALLAKDRQEHARPKARAVFAHTPPFLLVPPLGGHAGKDRSGVLRLSVFFGVEERKVFAQRSRLPRNP